MDYTFRHATFDDKDTIFKLYRSLVGLPGCAWSDEYPTEDNVIEDISNNSLYCLCSHKGDIVAAAFVGETGELDHLEWDKRVKKPCELARIGVSREHQNKGIGSMILCKVMEAAQSRGYDGVRMLVSKANPAALAMYDKNGFSRVGETIMFDIDWFCYEKVFGSN